MKAGTLILTGDTASDKLILIASSATLALDVGADGTAELTFHRSELTAIDIEADRGNDEVSASDPSSARPSRWTAAPR